MEQQSTTPPINFDYLNSLIEELKLEQLGEVSENSTSSSPPSFLNLSRVEGINRLPFAHRIILESLIRNRNFEDAAKIIDSLPKIDDEENRADDGDDDNDDERDKIWNFDETREAASSEQTTRTDLRSAGLKPETASSKSTDAATKATNDGAAGGVEIRFRPSRVLFQDFSGLSSLLDFAALRDAAVESGFDPEKINPSVPVDVFLDHSMTSDFRKFKSCPATAAATVSTAAPPRKASATKDSETASAAAAPKKYLPPHLRAKIAAAQLQQQQQGQGPSSRPRTSSSSTTTSFSTTSTPLTPEEAEWRRNKERLEFIKWSGEAFTNVNVVPPVAGMPHQAFLEYTSSILSSSTDGSIFPQTVIGTDAHTSLVNGLGILGITSGCLECESAMMGEGIVMCLPRVVGFQLKGVFNNFVTSTDVVVAINKKLKSHAKELSGAIVEFFGEAVPQLSIGDRMAVAQMSSESGIAAAFFPPDHNTVEYFRKKLQSSPSSTSTTSNSHSPIAVLDAFFETNPALRQQSYHRDRPRPVYAFKIELDVSEIVPSATGPRGAAHRVPLDQVKRDFEACRDDVLRHQNSTRSKSSPDASPSSSTCSLNGALKEGDVMTADIAAYTNATFPSVLLASGLLAKKALDLGLRIPSHVQACLRLPRCRLAEFYLRSVRSAFLSLGFESCDANEILPSPSSSSSSSTSSSSTSSTRVSNTDGQDVVLASVMSAKSPNESKHRANYLVYPPLVVAFALAGNVAVDLPTASLGTTTNGSAVLLHHLWPTRNEIQQTELDAVKPDVFCAIQSLIQAGLEQWNNLETPKSPQFRWNPSSTCLQKPRFLDRFVQADEKESSLTTPTTTSLRSELTSNLTTCRVVAIVGDSFSADHISLAGSIERESAAGQFLQSEGLRPRDFNSYGSRSGNEQVMIRGTFAHPKMDNKMTRTKGPSTIHVPSGEEMRVFEACSRYNPRYRQGIVDTPLVVLAGKDFGKGTNREWAVKGPWLMGIRVIIAESFGSNYDRSLLQVGILPLLFAPGTNVKQLGLTGKAEFSFFFDESNDVSIRLDDGRHFLATTPYQSKAALSTIVDGGFFAKAVKTLLTST